MHAVQIHFDGDIAKNHQVSMRTLGKTLIHLQNSFDRACIERRKGALWKHAKMPQAFYADVELLVQEPQEGGYVLDFFSKNAVTKAIIDRVSAAVKQAADSATQTGISQMPDIETQLRIKKTQIEHQIITPSDFNTLISQPNPSVIRRYGDRAIVREVDQILSIIRSSHAGNSTFELTLFGSTQTSFRFNKNQAKTFHNIVSERQLGDPVIYNAEVKSLDKPNRSGKITNLGTRKGANIIFADEYDLKQAIPFFESGANMRFIGCPFIEYGAFDPLAGDIFFVELSSNG